MDWKQIGNWYLESDKGYRISIGTQSCNLKFAAWGPGARAGDGKQALAYTSKLEQAKEACERHARGEIK